MFKVENDKLLIELPLTTTSGKIRVKERLSNDSHGNPVATKQNPFNENMFIEWRIGYDSDDLENKPTELKNLHFTRDGKRKYPYELSEYLYFSLKNDILDKKLFNDLSNYVNNVNSYIEDVFSIDRDNFKEINFEGIKFKQNNIIHPNFIFESCSNTIEIAINHKQRAVGYQAMVYLCIPLKNVNNYDDLKGRPAITKEGVIFEINKNNASLIIDLFKVFSVCSKRHSQDIREILKLIK